MFTTPYTWTANQVLTSSKLNEQLTANMAETAPGKATAAGQIFRALGANSIGALNVGTPGQILRVNGAGTDLEWGFITAANLADRTRNLFLTVNEFAALAGTPVINQLSTGFPAWAFDGAAEESIIALLKVPVDWASGALVVKLYWTNDSVTTGNVMWRLRLKDFTDADQLNGTGETTATDTIAAPVRNGSGYPVLKISTHSVALTPGGVVRVFYLQIDRRADQGGDTLNGIDAFVLGCEVVFTADS